MNQAPDTVAISIFSPRLVLCALNRHPDFSIGYVDAFVARYEGMRREVVCADGLLKNLLLLRGIIG